MSGKFITRVGHRRRLETDEAFRRICDELLLEAKRADDFLVDGLLIDTGMEVVVEVEAILDTLYGIKWGKNECLKCVVLAIGSQVNNTHWTQSHIGFLEGCRDSPPRKLSCR